ncbi:MULTISPECIES: NADase-type glycan-binding domain-containing protein [unclassified Nocardioides]|uniref:NADase-type glycan-binding domain-containing protein n=1 Tax=unclassified Nocardioides TaxID=2615069 RepID=UPI00361DAC6D
MDHCTRCGHELGIGRYCTNCGHPVAVEPEWRTDTAERSRPIPPPPDEPPPPAWTPPPPARFPLYADEAPPSDDTLHHAPVGGVHRARPWGLWIGGAAVAVLVLVVVIALLADDDTPPPAAEETASAAPVEEGAGGGGTGGGVGNLASQASVEVPATAAPGQDVAGEPVTFDAENMLDGVPETAWRMPGDGTGGEIVVTLASESSLRSVGLINGYAKKAEGRDWYHGNRRVEQVEWVFDDGTTISQDFEDTTGVQSTDVEITTTTITIRLIAVSEPGTGPSSRDFTAISDLSIVGES